MFDLRQLCETIDAKIQATGCNTNPFYELIQKRALSAPELKLFADQIYLNMVHFPRCIAGLSARVEEEVVRAELAQTVVAELGAGRPGRAHSELFEKALAPMGVTVRDWRTAYHTPETVALVEGVRQLFFEGPPLAGLGGNYTLERSGLPMLQALYEGFRLFPSSTIHSLEYFYLHLAIESEHIENMALALRASIKSEDDARLVAEGAVRIASLLSDFWQGIYRRIEPRTGG